MKSRSLRNQLVSGVVVSMVVVMSLVGIAVYWALKHESDEIFRARLNTSARVLEALITNQINHMPKGQPVFIELLDDFDKKEDREKGDARANQHPYEQKIAFQVWDDMGVLLAKSASAPTTRLGTLTEGSQSVRLDDETWEVFALRSGSIWVLAAEHNDVLEEKASKLAFAVLTPFVAGTLLLILFVNIQVYRGLTPLQLLAERIRSRQPESLEPIEEDAWPEELKTSVVALNDLLARVREAFEREQLFIDSAAHEMRTPVAGIQLHLQNALNATDPEAQRQGLREALEGVRRTTRLIEQMLALSRSINAQSQVRDGKKSYALLDVVCRDVVNGLSKQMVERVQTVKLDGDQSVAVQASTQQLVSIVQNLLENASKYGEIGRPIHVHIAETPTQVTLQVANDGAAIPDAEKDRIFRPHYRAAGQVHEEITGYGLGLAIVSVTVKHLDGTITVANRSGDQGSCFTVVFPAVASSASIDEE